MVKKFNYSPGPAMLPEAVMRKAQNEFCDWRDTGISVMEVSHRSQNFMNIARQAEHDLRELLAVPENYRVLFLQGGAQLQNAAVPMNILGEHRSANYLVTGNWSALAAQEARRYTNVVVACDMSSTQFTTVSPPATWQVDEQAAYFYYCDNETVYGIEFPKVPDVDLPIVADMSSNLLTRKIDITQYGIIFSCAQKNFGPAGVTVVIVRDDLLKQRSAQSFTPSVMDYRLQSARDSMVNTPPTFSWYMAGLVFQWIKEQGGVEEMDRLARQRSQLVYDYIDQSDLYECKVDPAYRSRMNIVFDLKDQQLNAVFLQSAHETGLLSLQGHVTRGGMRASMYNAMPLEGAEKLVDFLDAFQLLKKPLHSNS